MTPCLWFIWWNWNREVHETEIYCLVKMNEISEIDGLFGQGEKPAIPLLIWCDFSRLFLPVQPIYCVSALRPILPAECVPSGKCHLSRHAYVVNYWNIYIAGDTLLTLRISDVHSSYYLFFVCLYGKVLFSFDSTCDANFPVVWNFLVINLCYRISKKEVVASLHRS